MTPTQYKTTLIATVTLTAMMLAVFLLYTYAIMPGLKKVDDTAFVRSFQAIDRAIVNPLFLLQFFLPVGLFIALIYYAAKHQAAELKLLVAGFVAYLVVVIITLAVNVPLNDAIKAVGPGLSDQKLSAARVAFNETRWVTANLVRVILNLVAVVLAAVALGTSRVG